MMKSSTALMARRTSPVCRRPTPAQERLGREEKVLPVLHVHDRELAERVLVVPRRQVAAELVIAAENFRRELDERGESPYLRTEEVWVGDAHVGLGHDCQLIGTEGPVRRPALDETRLEIQERLIRFELEGGHRAVLADCDRLEIRVPVLLSADHHVPACCGIGDPDRSRERAFSLVEACLHR